MGIVLAILVALLIAAAVEYAAHRWVMHLRLPLLAGAWRNHHVAHHQAGRLDLRFVDLYPWWGLVIVAPIAAATWWAWPALSIALVLLPLPHSLAWCVLHRSYHDLGCRWARRLPGWTYLRAHHLEHHRDPHTRYGAVFGPLMDHMLGTYGR